MLKEKTTLLKKIKKQLTYNVRCAILYKLLLRKKRYDKVNKLSK